MKKTILIIIFILLTYYFISEVTAKTLTIPEEAIRFRVVPHSNEKIDQDVKILVRDEVQNYMSNILQNVDDIEVSREIISSNIPEISAKVEQVLENKNYTLPYKVNFGLNYFPSKEYKGVTYEEGYYESLVITLGSGEGSNWWCVLFPPLCLIEAEESTEVEYTSYVKEILDKYV